VSSPPPPKHTHKDADNALLISPVNLNCVMLCMLLRPPSHGASLDTTSVCGLSASCLSPIHRYLISVRPQDVSLLQQHAGWILQADPEAGLELLLGVDPPLHYTLVLPLLEVRGAVHTVWGGGITTGLDGGGSCCWVWTCPCTTHLYCGFWRQGAQYTTRRGGGRWGGSTVGGMAVQQGG
jgi:hypothetical protein